MTKAKLWAARLHLGQLIMLSFVFAIISCGAGIAAIALTDDSDSCGELHQVQDSISLNRVRLLSVDSALLRFDLSQIDEPLQRLRGAPTSAAKDGVKSKPTLERNIVALRAQGADAKDLREYLIAEHLKENPAGFSRDKARRQLASIHELESDTLYRQYVRETAIRDDGARYDSHDTLRLSNQLASVTARCSRYRLAMPVMLTLWLGSLGMAFTMWWWWFGGRKA